MTRDKQLVARELASRGLDVATMHLADTVVRAKGGRTPYSNAVRTLGATTSHRLHVTRPARGAIHKGRDMTRAIDHVHFQRSHPNFSTEAGNISRHAIVKALLRHGAHPDGNNQDRRHHWLGSSPLVKAIYNNDVVLVEMLIKAGADVNAKDDLGRTPLWRAAEFPGFYGPSGSAYRVGCLRALLMAKADPNIHDGYTTTPLMNVCEAQTHLPEWAEDYFEAWDPGFHDPDPELDHPRPAIYGTTKRAAVRLLLDAKANPNIRNPENGWTALHYAVLPEQYAFLWMPPEFAVERDIEIVRMLLAAGADPNVGGIFKWIRKNKLPVSAEIMHLLISREAKV